MKKISIILLLIYVLSIGVASAAPPPQSEGQTYIVQADDWLSKVAEKFYGDVLLWSVILEATNAKASEDDSFTVIENPDIIQGRWGGFLTQDAQHRAGKSKR